MKRILLGIACVIVALVGVVWAFSTPRSKAPELLQRYVFNQIPDSLKVLEFERQGHREWSAFFHFQLAPEDFPKLLQGSNPVRITPDSVHPDDIASSALRLFKKHLPNADLAKSYEIYALQRTNSVTENFLTVNKEHSEGLVVVIRY